GEDRGQAIGETDAHEHLEQQVGPSCPHQCSLRPADPQPRPSRSLQVMSSEGSSESDEVRWQRAAEQLDESAALLDEGRIGEALALTRICVGELEAVVGAEHPDFANALQLLGEIALALGDTAEANAQFESARAIYERHMLGHRDIVGPLRASVLELLARTRTMIGRYDEAESLI